LFVPFVERTVGQEPVQYVGDQRGNRDDAGFFDPRSSNTVLPASEAEIFRSCEKRGTRICKPIAIFFDGAGQVIQATEAVQLERVSQTITQQLCADASSDSTTPTEGRCAELLVLLRRERRPLKMIEAVSVSSLSTPRQLKSLHANSKQLFSALVHSWNWYDDLTFVSGRHPVVP
jgi:hypothetical protein